MSDPRDNSQEAESGSGRRSGENSALQNGINSADSAENKPSAQYYRSKIGEGKVPEAAAPKSDLVSVEDVLNTANLNDRMEMARLRHAQILALRGRARPDANKPGNSAKPAAQKEAMRFPVGTRKSTPAPEVKAAAVVAAPAIAAPVVEAPVLAPAAAQPKNRRKVVMVAAAAIVALLLGLAIPGPFRDYAVRTGNQVLALATTGQAVDAPGTTAPIIQSQIGSPAPAPNLDIQQATLLASVRQPALRNRRSDAPLATAQFPEAGPSALLGAAVPVFIPTAAQSGRADIAISPAPDVLPRLADAPLPPDIAALAATNFVILSFEDLGAVRLGGQTLRVATQEIQPDPRLGRLVPNYILANLPLPIAMAGIGRSLGLPRVPTSAEITQNLPVSNAVLFAPKLAGITLVTPVAPTSVAFVRPRAPAPVLVAPKAGGAGISPQGVLPFSVSLPATSVAPKLPEGGPALAARPMALSVFVAPVAPAKPDSSRETNPYQLINLSLNVPASSDRQGLTELVENLRASGFPSKDANFVDFAISRTNVRYFHASDADAAAALAEIVGGRARNFTDYRPQPPQGTVEVWMAGESAARPASGTRAPARRSAEDQALQSLRDRLLQRLRAGDHL